ncbi:unnamed protein product [Parnassius mnemosyne]|uniref:C2H2-type domain-containing protein n=1 Tax=Parnassius mnemosyne TaxID=213953 RepID=A0AAV1K944_9NEOP
MNASPGNIIINSCQYTPVYVIQNPSVSPTRSYVLAQSDEYSQKPVGDSLKSFYENSGKLANNLQESKKCEPKILKKVDSSIVGNNLKLASFLLPKNDTSKQYVAPVNNIGIKPIVSSCNTHTITNVVNTVPKLDINRKIVKLKSIPNSTKTSFQGRKLPKTKPKENSQNPSKHTSVQLLKLGETYHSLNQLSDDQMKIVNHALKIFSDPKKTPKEPAYDPITNTRFIYKVLSPKDLTIVGKNKLIFKQKRAEVKKDNIKKEEEVIFKKKPDKKEVKPIIEKEIHEEPAAVLETKVTRSGRKVKLPKHHTTEEETPHKPRKKNGTIVSCFQCSLEFSSLYRLQRHYENHPTHIPAKIHSNLFHCLLAIIKSGSEEDRANIFIQQLEQLIAKFKSLLPCLFKKADGRHEGNEGTKLCTINDDIGRLFGMNPGKYNVNMDALTCVKDTEGHCRHNPKTNQLNSDLDKPSQSLLSSNIEDITNSRSEVEDCARINSVAKWPTVTKRNWKQKLQNSNAKKVKMDSECDSSIELVMDDFITFNETNETDLLPQCVPLVTTEVNQEPTVDKSLDILKDETKKPSHIQFHSTHFDIRSSPIKQSSTVFCKFQINPEKIPKYEVQIIKPLDIENEFIHENNAQSNTESINSNVIFNENIDLPAKGTENNLDFVNKDWTISMTNEQTVNNIESNTLIEPALLHFKYESLNKNTVNDINNQNDNLVLNNLTNQNQSVLNFLDSLGNDCLSYPETEIRNNAVDFQLDLFSFNNT